MGDAPELYRILIDQYLVRPEADQEPYYSMAEGLDPYVTSVTKAAGDAHQHMTRLLSSGRGEAMDALGEHWDTVRNQHLTAVSGAGTHTALVAQTVGRSIAVAKAELVEVAAGCAETAMAGLATGALTFGASDGIVTQAVANARTLAQKIVATCHQQITAELGRLLRDPAVAGLPGVAAVLTGTASGGVAGGVAAGVAGAGAGGDGALPAGTGPGKGIEVDHAEHERAAGNLREVAAHVHGETSTALAAVASHNATGAASGDLGAAVSGTFTTVLDDLATATGAFGDYLNGVLPDAVLRISGDQRTTDDGNRKRFGQL
ncbi:hypothetical protein [Streptomyces globisporus]|uniref:hypothetical protein n=1 Tax=Streptomyces globisporus TaxID=1908 RepID=UPI0004CBD5E1|nr:hypothetical protein [Streptomyces globisporus]